MKPWSGLLVAILMIAPASAQVASWSDPVGDQAIEYRATQGEEGTTYDVPNDQGWYPRFDITRAGIYEETEDTITFELVLASTEPQGTEPENPYLIDYFLHFTYHDEPMRVYSYWYADWNDQPYSWVERLEGDYWQYVTWVDTQPHPEEPGWLMTVRKWQLRDTQLIPAREGDTIGNIHASAARSQYDWGSGVGMTGLCPDADGSGNLGGPGCGFRPTDEAGTESSPLGEYTLTQSPEGLGHILLETERPFRASNGLATTYVYEMRLFNLDDEPDAVQLAAANIPSGWDIYLPTRVELDGNEVKDIRMAIGVPFGHKHGESASVEIRAKSEQDSSSTSSTYLSVFWPEIAQPSGHHPFIYFHSDGWRPWMNTVDEDPQEDDGGVIPADTDGCGGICLIPSLEDPEPQVNDVDYYWHFPLRPGLFTGLDFETDQTIDGNLEIAIDSSKTATVTTQLILYREDQEPLTIGTQEQEVSFTAGEAESIAVTMPVDPAADRLPYRTNSALYFFTTVQPDDQSVAESGGEDAQGFVTTPGDMEYAGELYSANSYLDLPLLDFHDDVDPGLLDALTRLQLEAPEEISRPGNPGRTLAYFFEVINKGEEDDTVEWSIEGPKADWATVVPGHTKVDSQGTSTVAIRVDIPEDAISDDVADLLLVGQSTKDPDAQVFGNFQAYVEVEADIPDESERFAELQDTAEKTEAKGAPFPVAVVFAALAVAAVARRRTQ